MVSGPIDLELGASISGITCHAWNRDRSLLAVSYNATPDIHIYYLDGAKLALRTILKGHYGLVTGLDWAPQSDQLASCGHDRNVFIWKQKNGSWSSTLVMARLSRAATCIQWSPKEDKLAVGSSESVIAICYRDPEEHYWKTRHLEKDIEMSTMTLAWHPNNVLLAIGGIDAHARVVSAYVKGLDEKPAPSPWGDRLPFGTLCAKFSSEGWIHSVAFSPSGDQLAWSCRVSRGKGKDPINVTLDQKWNNTVLHLANPGAAFLTSFFLPQLPFKQLLFIKENYLVAAGYDYCLYAFSAEKKDWKCLGRLTGGSGRSPSPSPGSVSPVEQKFDQAFDRFKKLDVRGQGAKTSGESSTESLTSLISSIGTAHRHPVSCIRLYSQDQGRSKVSSSSLDGKIFLWDMGDGMESVTMQAPQISKLANKAPAVPADA